jgi:putative oxidoreductase
MTRTDSSEGADRSRFLHVTLWVVQVLLAAAFLFAGIPKITQPIAELAAEMDWVGALAPWLVRFIGVCEAAGALGLLLPTATRISPTLTPVAAIGLLLIMVFAAVFHALRGELAAIPVNVFLGALAAFIAWGRLKKAPIAPR